MTDLFVHSCNNGSPYSHSRYETTMEVLMNKDRLSNGCQEHQSSVEITLPLGLRLIRDIGYQQPLQQQKQTNE